MIAPLSTPAHARAILALGLPLIGSSLAQIALHVTDTVMLGWYAVEALAAGTLGASTFFVVFVLGSGFGKAVLPLVAAARGAGDGVQVRRTTRMGLWHSILFGVAVYPLFWWSGPILLAAGQDPRIADLTEGYLRIAGAGMIPALLVFTFISFLSALERTQVVLWATLAGVAINIALNYAFIFGNWGAPELGVAGAAVASVAVQLATLAIVAGYAAALPGLRGYRLFQRVWRADWQAFAQVWRLGWPIGITGLAEAGLFHASALMMGWIGTVELAAHGIALQAASIAFMVHVGLASAATVRAGAAFGARDPQALRDGARVAIGLSQAVGLAIIAAFVIWPEAIIGAFIDQADPDAGRIVAFGTTLLLLAALFQIADAAQVMAVSLLRGLQDTRVPMILATLSYWAVGIPASYLLAFPLGLGGVGLWLGLVIGLTVAAGTLMHRFWTRAPRP
ncbi:MAG: MATE family efflux transporter [Gemmobacter sp.]